MLTSDAIKHYGNLNKVQKALGYASGTCYSWGEIVPAKSAAMLYSLSDGQIPFRASDYSPVNSDKESLSHV